MRSLSLGVLIAGLVLALALGLSALFAHAPQALLDRWDDQGHIGTEEEWREALNLLHLAMRLNPWDAALPLAVGRFHHWRATRYGILDTRRHEALVAAEHAYRQALALRPSWSLAWLYLADALVLDRRLHREGLEALREVLRLDPYGTYATQRALELMAMAWRLLDTDDRCRFAAVVAYRDAWKNAWRSLGGDARERVMRALPDGALDRARLRELSDWIVARRDAYIAASPLQRLVIGLQRRPRDLAARYCASGGGGDAGSSR